MHDDQPLEAVRELRERGRSPKEIARGLGVRPAAITDLIRALAVEAAAAAREPALVGCWVSPGWSIGLTIGDSANWQDGPTGGPGGVASVLVARRERSAITVCGYLADVYCLGVKNAVGPQRMHQRDLTVFVREYFAPFASPPLAAPIELARDLVLGSVQYAAALGFTPHRDFGRARPHLGPWTAPGAIRFGCNGKPRYTEGPYDDPAAVLRTLERSVGRDGYHFTVSIGSPELVRSG